MQCNARIKYVGIIEKIISSPFPQCSEVQVIRHAVVLKVMQYA